MLDLLNKLWRESKISARFRFVNVVSFAVVSVLIFVSMFFLLKNITNTVSSDYAMLYSSNTVGTINTYFGSQIALMKKVAHSNAVIEWFGDEYNQEKKLDAYEEMMEIIDSLASKNLYIGIEKTLNEFSIEENFSMDDIKPFATLQPGYYDDAWYFECTSSDKEYLLNVDIDKILHRKRVWLNYKVTRDGTAYGAICTWLEFSDLIENIFSEYDSRKVRGLVIDEAGAIHMDSFLLGYENFLNYTVGNETLISEEISDPAFLAVLDAYTKDMDGYFDMESDTAVIEMSGGKYRYATIAPIASTTWSVVTLYDASSLFGIANLMPLLIIVLTMLMVFIIATNLTSKKLVFEPFEELTHSIERIKENEAKKVYGLERNDEIGEIANTVQDMKDSLIDALCKMHYDALTGIYTRRFLDESLSRVLRSLARSGDFLSVLMIDIDFFKRYNDTYGHEAGDACLKAIADALVSSVGRADDFVARFGGEEFVVILPGANESGARTMADKLLKNVAACKIPHATSDVSDYVTISIGATTDRVKTSQSGSNYIRRADEALYISKNEGRNRYTFIDFE